MGKARILEAHGEGRYTIEIIEARERAELAKQEAEARIQTLRANIAALEQRIASAQATVNQAAAEQDAAINHYQQEMAEEGQSSINLDAFSRDLLEAASQRDALQAEQRTHELRIAADEALVARINALPPLRQMQAWCADYTEDLSGEVATAEVPGEIGSVIIKPGFEGNAWSAAEDGALQPTLASTPAATFYNLAMLPGWQKWRPTFRTATITRLDGDTCSITLDAATSSQQGLGFNAQSSYSNVPILYMDCNGSAFEEGDRVLVAFAGNVEGPTVVGFKQEPRVCGILAVVSFDKNTQASYTPIGTISQCSSIEITSDHTPWRLAAESLVQKNEVKLFKLPASFSDTISVTELEQIGSAYSHETLIQYTSSLMSSPDHYSSWTSYRRDNAGNCTVPSNYNAYTAPLLNNYLIDYGAIPLGTFKEDYASNYYNGVAIDPTIFDILVSDETLAIEIGHRVSNEQDFIDYNGSAYSTAVSKTNTHYIKHQNKSVNIAEAPVLSFNGKELVPKKFIGFIEEKKDVVAVNPDSNSNSEKNQFKYIDRLSILIAYSFR